MTREYKNTVEQIEAALRNNNGLLTQAAEDLDCAWETVSKRIIKSERSQG